MKIKKEFKIGDTCFFRYNIMCNYKIVETTITGYLATRLDDNSMQVTQYEVVDNLQDVGKTNYFHVNAYEVYHSFKDLVLNKENNNTFNEEYIEIPCKVGDDIYTTTATEVKKIRINKIESFYHPSQSSDVISLKGDDDSLYSLHPKDIFQTEEEAIQYLYQNSLVKFNKDYKF